MTMKKITNKNFVRFCDVIKRSLTDFSKFDECLSDMVNASEDGDNKVFVYTDSNHNMEVIKLDEYTNDFKIRRRLEDNSITDYTPKAVDAVCVNKENEWFLIEFKNQPLESAINGATKKMHSSLWLIAFLYSTLSETMSDDVDILRFAREHITFILVVNSEKNGSYEEAIGTTWEENGPFYSPYGLKKYKGYYFKELYVLTEKGLKFFIESFDK